MIFNDMPLSFCFVLIMSWQCIDQIWCIITFNDIQWYAFIILFSLWQLLSYSCHIYHWLSLIVIKSSTPSWGCGKNFVSTICYGPTSGTTHLMDLVNFSFFTLSYLIISDFEPWGDSLQELTYLTPFTLSQTRVCLMANLVPLNLTLPLTVHFRAVHGYAATHMHITHVLCFSSILPPPCGCIMSLISVNACPKQYW